MESIAIWGVSIEALFGAEPCYYLWIWDAYSWYHYSSNFGRANLIKEQSQISKKGYYHSKFNLPFIIHLCLMIHFLIISNQQNLFENVCLFCFRIGLICRNKSYIFSCFIIMYYIIHIHVMWGEFVAFIGKLSKFPCQSDSDLYVRNLKPSI